LSGVYWWIFLIFVSAHYAREGHGVNYRARYPTGNEMGDDNENPFFEAAMKAAIARR
jgi:hypothetical protein